MCGITGALLLKESLPDLEFGDRLLKMAQTLHHRGPDHMGQWSNGHVGFGHSRLSIIDLTKAAHQPMIDENERVSVVFNGEIYNFRELRQELEQQGCVFHSHSDTEVLVHGFLKWGTELFRRLRGMFAIAIFDIVEQRLILARDRIGKKPLFYGQFNGAFLFGSEIKAILAWPGVPREANYEAIHHYLTYQYVPNPHSAFQNIWKMPQAHFMVIDRKGNRELSRYWSLPRPRNTSHRPLEELKSELLHHLEEAVSLRMVSDVPLGAFLSGGVDSSAVVAMMARLGNKPVKTFSIGFKEKDYDETAYARMVAERCETDHHEMIVEPDAVSILPKLVWHYNEPFADSSAIPTYYLCQMARRHVTVALNGDAGDENFIGYPRYMTMQEWSGGACRTFRGIRAFLRGARDALQKGERKSRLYEPTIVYFREIDKDEGYGDILSPYQKKSSLDMLDPYFDAAPDMVSGAAWADIHTYLPDDLLVKVDIASMANSLEARSPFLDHKLMEWAATIPLQQKLLNGETKGLLKWVLKDYLPDEILHRPKMGFGVPIDLWFRAELKELLWDTLLSERARQRRLFKPEWVEHILKEHNDGVQNHQTRLWAMLMLHMWFDAWIDRK